MSDNGLSGIVWGIIPFVRKTTLEDITTEFEEPEIFENARREIESENSAIVFNLRYLEHWSVGREEEAFAERLALIVYFAINREYQDREPEWKMPFASGSMIWKRIVQNLIRIDSTTNTESMKMAKKSPDAGGTAYEDRMLLGSPETTIQSLIFDGQYELHEYLSSQTNFARGKFGNNLAAMMSCLVYLSLKEAEKDAAFDRLDRSYAAKIPIALLRS